MTATLFPLSSLPSISLLSLFFLLLHLVLQSSSVESQALTFPVAPSPWGIVSDGVGHVYFTDTFNKSIIKATTAGQVLAVIPSSSFTPALVGPTGLAIDSSGNLYVVDSYTSRVVKFSPTGSQLQVFTTSSPSLIYPLAVAVDAQMNVWISDPSNQRVVQVYPNGYQGTVVTASSPSMSGAADVAVDSSGSVYIADTFNSRVLKWTFSQGVTTFYSQLSQPVALAVDGQNNVFIGDSGLQQVLQVSSAGSLLQTLTVPSLSPSGLTVDNAGNLLVADYQNNRLVAFPSASLPATGSLPDGTARLCLVMYSLPGTIDYPWSLSYSLTVTYDSTTVVGSSGAAVTLLSGTGTRTFTNKFAISSSTSVTLLPSLGSLLYFNSSLPVDSVGLTFTLSSPVQQPGGDPLTLRSQLNVNSASGYLMEGGCSLIDKLGQAVQSSIPGFMNSSIGAANVNSFAVNYAQCQAPITFTNGLRSPTQPSVSNGGLRLSYSYSITDNSTYSVQTNLTISTTSAFATTQDLLGNPYQTVIDCQGSRTYTVLATGYTLTSSIAGLATVNLSSSLHADQRFYPYALLASSPGVYTINSAPFLDSDGLSFTVSPAIPSNGLSTGVMYNSVTISLVANSNTSSATLTESPSSSTNPPVYTLQRQTYLIDQ